MTARRCVVLTPSFLCDARLAIAANRAGSVGILDLAHASDLEAVEQVALLRQHSRAAKRWGIRWDLFEDAGRFQVGEGTVLSALGRIPVLIVGGINFDVHDLTEVCTTARQIADKVIAEVYSVGQAKDAVAAGFDSVLIKGNAASGRVSPQASFVLVQQLRDLKIPYLLQGGIGPETAAAAFCAGATGVVLCEQLWLAKESPFEAEAKQRLSRFDGSETTVLVGQDRHYRVLVTSNRELISEIDTAVVSGASLTSEIKRRSPQASLDVVTVTSHKSPSHDVKIRSQQGAAHAVMDSKDVLVAVGQDIGFATPSTLDVSVADLLRKFHRRTKAALLAAKDGGAIHPGSPLAQQLKTEFPVMQGPMTRVSDVPGFCKAVVDEGGLPFLALALLRGKQVRELMEVAAAENANKSWGVGILGFVPAELRKEQLAVVEEIRPPYAIIAGGRPSQAKRLEELGIATYLHVPSPGLLDSFLSQGATRFIFEGRECGGHVGPRDSFTLWQLIIDRLFECPADQLKQLEIVFAGGIHDAYSSALVSILASSLADLGVKVGVLMGTAYLFTEEAVTGGAIGAEFQAQAIACQSTVLLQSGIGHATRCAPTPFSDEFATLRKDLLQSRRSADEIREALEVLNIGRLRLASKGVERKSDPMTAEERSDLVEATPEEQRQRGMYMIGEVAAFHDSTMTVRQLHESVTVEAKQVCSELTQKFLASTRQGSSKAARLRKKKIRSGSGDLAIVGMAGMFPEASDVRQFWSNIMQGVNSVTEVPRDRWNVDAYFDENRQAPDKVYSRWGGYLSPTDFDPMKWGMPPSTVASIDPMQLLSLEIAWRAIVDAGMHSREACSQRTSVIFAAAGVTDFGSDYLIRSSMRQYLPLSPSLDAEQRERVIADLEARLPEWTEDSFPGFLLNVVAGRIANRLNVSGANFTVDAACAGSLAALHVAANQLRLGEIDSAIVGAVDLCNNPFTYLSFAKTHALSPRGRSRPFDETSDGIALGEAVVALVIKRVEDAERDGDRIYSVIRGVGFSSDGRNRSMTAPYPVGQRKAMARAYRDAGFHPRTVGLFEAHGTGTAVGDMSEVTSLLSILPKQANGRRAALGSVKSNIGHTKAAAGLVSIIKASLALDQRVLPPTIGVDRPHAQLADPQCPLYVSTEARPWSTGSRNVPRRASVSSFGFGGTNFHVTLEEYQGSFDDRQRTDLLPRQCEIFSLEAADRGGLIEQLHKLQADCLASSDDFRLFAAKRAKQSVANSKSEGCRLAFLSSGRECLSSNVATAIRMIEQGQDPDDGVDLFFGAKPPISSENVCFLYPGQGSQARNMLRELFYDSQTGPDLLSRADRVLSGHLNTTISDIIFPLPALDRETQEEQLQTLSDTSLTQPALAVVEAFATEMLARFNLHPGFVAGHSFGEYVALWSAGVWTFEDLLSIAAARGRVCRDASRITPGGMAVVPTDCRTAQALIDEFKLDLSPANINGPKQTVVAGPVTEIDRAIECFERKGHRCTKLRVSAAFHSRFLQEAAADFSSILEKVSMSQPQVAVASNTSGKLHEPNVEAIRQSLVEHLTKPVQFEQMIKDLADRSVQVFIEVGPRQILGGLVRKIVDRHAVHVLSLDGSGGNSWESLARVLGRCLALGLPVDLNEWYRNRSAVVPTAVADGPTPLPSTVKRAPVWTMSPTRPVNPNKAKVTPREVPPPVLPQPSSSSAASPPKDERSADVAESLPELVQYEETSTAGALEQPYGGTGHEVPAVRIVKSLQLIPLGSTENKSIETAGGSRRVSGQEPQLADSAPVDSSGHYSSTLSSYGEIPVMSQYEIMQTPAEMPTFEYEQVNAMEVGPTNILERWLQLQIEQQRVTERIVALQERLMSVSSVAPRAPQPLMAVSAPVATKRIQSAPQVVVQPAPITNRMVATPVISKSAAVAPTPSISQPRVSPPARVHTNGNGASKHQNGAPSAKAPATAPPAVVPPVVSTPVPAPVVKATNGVAVNGQAAAPAKIDSALSVDAFQTELLLAVSDRTGYPVEALDLTTPLESGLGIDSIKTVEIFSKLKRFHDVFQGDGEDEEDVLADFAKLKTLGDIVLFYKSRLPDEAADASTNGATTTSGATIDNLDPVKRYEVASTAVRDEKKN